MKGKGIGAVIKPRKNSVLNTRSDARRQEVDLYRSLGHQRWAEEKVYGRQVGRPERRHIPPSRGRSGSVLWLRKTMASAARELAAKAAIYNMLARM